MAASLTTSSKKPSRTNHIGAYYEVYSKYARFRYGMPFPEAHPRLLAWYAQHIKCRECNYPSYAYSMKPRPFDVHVLSDFRGIECSVLEIGVSLVRLSLVDALAEFLSPTLVWSDVFLAGGDTPPRRLDFRALQVPRSERVSTFRRRGCNFAVCVECGRVYSSDYSKGEAIVEHAAKGRPIVHDFAGSIYVREDIVKQLDLANFSEDIRLHKIPLLRKPEDGWVLPEDPEWDGILLSPDERARRRPTI